MNGDMRIAHHRVEDEARDMLAKDVEDRVADAALDPDTDTLILTRIGAWALRRHLPTRTLEAIRDFSGTGSHALLLDNLPRQELPATPVHGFCAETELAATNAIHLGLIQLLGLTPYAVDYENSGRLMRNVVPNPAAAGTTSSWGADSEFFWHTDNPHLPFGPIENAGTDPRPYIPRFLTFYAARNHELVPTEVMAVETAIGQVTGAAREVLTAPAFEVAAPDSNDTGTDGARLTLGGAPVVESHVDGPFVRYDKGTTKALNPTAGAALDAWVAALSRAPAWQPVLAPGQFLAFDNYRVLHRRRAFTPHPEQDDARWLRRCYAS